TRYSILRCAQVDKDRTCLSHLTRFGKWVGKLGRPLRIAGSLPSSADSFRFLFVSICDDLHPFPFDFRRIAPCRIRSAIGHGQVNERNASGSPSRDAVWWDGLVTMLELSPHAHPAVH